MKLHETQSDTLNMDFIQKCWLVHEKLIGLTDKRGGWEVKVEYRLAHLANGVKTE